MVGGVVHAELLRARGVEVHRVARGGEATYHGPGQAVLYPIVPLAPAKRAACSIAGGGGGAGRGRDALAIGVRRYVEHLEDVMVAAAQRRGVAARGRVPGRTGVWVGGCSSGEQNTGRKLGAVGVQLKERVTTHGLALNVDMDLSAFRELIVPCGLPGGEATSLAREMAAAGGDGQRPSVEAVLREMASDLAERLGLRMEERPAEQLLEELGALQPELNGGVV